MKKILALVLVLALCLGMLAACVNPQPTDPKPTETKPANPTEPQPTEPQPTEPADPIEALPGSIYYFGYPVEGLGSMVQFFHFYPDDLGIGAVFYAGYAWNQIVYSGTYTVTEEPCNYAVYTEKTEESVLVEGTAPYTITFYDWDGNELDKIGYDGEYVYNDSVNVNSDPMAGGGTFRQSKADAAALEAYADTFNGEKGIAYKNFISPDDGSCTIQLNTNGTYSDLMIFAVDGTWSKNEDGSYTLTPKSSSDNGATLKPQEDGTFLYASTDGTQMVVNEVREAAVAFTFKGKTPFMDTEADLTILAMDDGTAVVNIAAFGMEVAIDKGTWSEAGYTFTFEFDGAGQIVSAFGGSTGVQVVYVCESVAAIGGGPVNAPCDVVLG